MAEGDDAVSGTSSRGVRRGGAGENVRGSVRPDTCTYPRPVTPAGQTAEQVFECASKSVPVARRFLTARLEEWSQDALVWDGQQIVTELVANAVLHAAGAELTVRLMLLDLGALRIEVVDGGARLPRVRRYGADASTGRGLALVADLARAWGVDRLPDGKVVWCEIAPEATAER
ncbi:MAG: ATP-binding protein, partial [Actinotalea sp.]|nr:ATP-binding protein [Actinotalea sp.]